MKKIKIVSFVAIVCLIAAGSLSAWKDNLYKAPKSVTAGEAFEVTYSQAMSSPADNRFWITIIDITAADSEWGAWVYVEDGATSTTLTAPATPGKYEIRLHGNYPTKSFDVLQRSPLKVK